MKGVTSSDASYLSSKFAFDSSSWLAKIWSRDRRVDVLRVFQWEHQVAAKMLRLFCAWVCLFGGMNTWTSGRIDGTIKVWEADPLGAPFTLPVTNPPPRDYSRNTLAHAGHKLWCMIHSTAATRFLRKKCKEQDTRTVNWAANQTRIDSGAWPISSATSLCGWQPPAMS